MFKNLVIVLSGKKQAGKSSLANYIASEYMNLLFKDDEGVWFELDNKDCVVARKAKGAKKFDQDLTTHGVKLYSFADSLKEFCLNVLGLDIHQCYGTDKDKNSKTHIAWSSLPPSLCKEYAKEHKIKNGPNGYLSGRQVLQIFGTKICRRLDPNAWVRGTCNSIIKENTTLSIVGDARFPNEITMTGELGAKSIRLTRQPFDDGDESETALDEFPFGEYSLVLDNTDMTRDEKQEAVRPYIHKLFKEYNIGH